MKNINQETMNIISSYMNDEIREDVHADLAPCTPNEFLEEYLKRDTSQEFRDILANEFYMVADN